MLKPQSVCLYISSFIELSLVKLLIVLSVMRKSVPTILETKQLPDLNYLGPDKIIVSVTVGEFAAAVSRIESVELAMPTN